MKIGYRDNPIWDESWPRHIFDRRTQCRIFGLDTLQTGFSSDCSGINFKSSHDTKKLLNSDVALEIKQNSNVRIDLSLYQIFSPGHSDLLNMITYRSVVFLRLIRWRLLTLYFSCAFIKAFLHQASYQRYHCWGWAYVRYISTLPKSIQNKTCEHKIPHCCLGNKQDFRDWKDWSLHFLL